MADRECDNLVRIVAPVISAMPQLIHVIQQKDATIAVLESELSAERERRLRAEEGKERAEAEAERWYHKTLRLKALLECPGDYESTET